MKIKKSLLILFFVISILFIIISFLVIKHLNFNTASPSQNTISDKESNIGYDVSSLPKTTIDSTIENPIQKDNIEATHIEIINNGGELQVFTTLKNNSNEPINGLFIEIDLLDETGNTLSKISQNTEIFIDANKEITLENNIVGIEGETNITNAKIVFLEKNTIQNSIENSITQIAP